MMRKGGGVHMSPVDFVRSANVGKAVKHPHHIDDDMGFRPRGATPHQVTPGVWAQIGGKWVLFGHGGRETVSPYMSIFLEGLHLYGCAFREFTALWVYF